MTGYTLEGGVAIFEVGDLFDDANAALRRLGIEVWEMAGHCLAVSEKDAEFSAGVIDMLRIQQE